MSKIFKFNDIIEITNERFIILLIKKTKLYYYFSLISITPTRLNRLDDIIHKVKIKDTITHEFIQSIFDNYSYKGNKIKYIGRLSDSSIDFNITMSQIIQQPKQFKNFNLRY